MLADALSSRARRAALEAVLDRSGVAELLDGWMPKGGRHGQLGAKSVLMGMLMALVQGRPAHLSAGHEALFALDVADQVRLGALGTADGALHPATYRQFSHTHQVMVAGIDPTPVPSFKGVFEEDRAAHLAAAREGIRNRRRRDGRASRLGPRHARGSLGPRGLQERIVLPCDRLDRP
ncbi:MAG: hypothetical protein M0Z46_15070 [Actinomycetota bacterium]|nr:hypothetical protein [Actinomycetota bacterium]MDA8359686.1 hypothetical protein [Actinomycetota bacterium]